MTKVMKNCGYLMLMPMICFDMKKSSDLITFMIGISEKIANCKIVFSLPVTMVPVETAVEPMENYAEC